MKTGAVLQDFGSYEDEKDEYYYGYRMIIGYDRGGRESVSYRPLTLDDFLNPEEGDVYMEGTLHESVTEWNYREPDGVLTVPSRF